MISNRNLEATGQHLPSDPAREHDHFDIAERIVGALRMLRMSNTCKFKIIRHHRSGVSSRRRLTAATFRGLSRNTSGRSLHGLRPAQTCRSTVHRTLRKCAGSSAPALPLLWRSKPYTPDRKPPAHEERHFSPKPKDFAGVRAASWKEALLGAFWRSLR